MRSTAQNGLRAAVGPEPGYHRAVWPHRCGGPPTCARNDAEGASVAVITSGTPDPDETDLCRVNIQLSTRNQVTAPAACAHSAGDGQGAGNAGGQEPDIIVDYSDPGGPAIRHLGRPSRQQRQRPARNLSGRCTVMTHTAPPDPVADQQPRRADEIEDWVTDLRITLSDDPPDWLTPDDDVNEPGPGFPAVPSAATDHTAPDGDTMVGTARANENLESDPPGPAIGRHRATE